MKFNTPSGLHAALANVDILIDETYSAGACTFSLALGKSQEQAPKGRGRGGSGYAMHIALHSARTDSGGLRRTGGQGQNTGGAWSNTAGHRDSTGRGKVGQGMLCKLLSIVSCLVLRQQGLE